jgi:hypothetical protein
MVQRPSDKKYTKQSRGRVNTDTRGVLMGGDKGTEKALT